MRVPGRDHLYDLHHNGADAKDEGEEGPRVDRTSEFAEVAGGGWVFVVVRLRLLLLLLLLLLVFVALVLVVVVVVVHDHLLFWGIIVPRYCNPHQDFGTGGVCGFLDVRYFVVVRVRVRGSHAAVYKKKKIYYRLQILEQLKHFPITRTLVENGGKYY